ncbi:MAG: hypothetical protein NTY35_06970 [Planctomycetota bacterium]|nr:hypothetical protein [Planctomycetota bacterium]
MSRVLVATLLAAALAGCSAPRLAVEPRVARPSVSGHVASAAPGDPLTSNDIAGDLNLEEDDAAPGVRADLEFGSPHVVLAWSRSENEGDGTLTGQIADDGVVLTAGTDVATSVDLGLFSALVTFDLVPSETFELGLGFGLHVADLEADVVSREVGNPGRVRLDTTIPIPVLALQAGAEFGRFEISGLLSGIYYAADGDEATFYDVDLGARFRILGESVAGSIAAGWHYTRLDAEYADSNDNADVDLRLSGPYLGLTISF